MSPEFNLSGKKGVRGKYAKAYRAGHTVRVYKDDKLVADEYFAAIDADVLKYYPDSKIINRTLGKLISLVPQNGKTSQKQS